MHRQGDKHGYILCLESTLYFLTILSLLLAIRWVVYKLNLNAEDMLLLLFLGLFCLSGTSNWSADYFQYTGGIGLVVSQPRGGSGNSTVNIRQQLADVFERDWYSEHAFYLDQLNVTQSAAALSHGHTEL